MNSFASIIGLVGRRPSRRASRPAAGQAVVAIVSDAVAPYHRGGKEQWIQAVAPRLNRYLDVHIYTMKWWRGPRTVHHDGVPYHAISRHMPLYGNERRSILQAIGFALSCLRLLRVDFDVLVADHMPYLQLFPLKVVALVRGRPLAVTWHEVWSRAQWRTYLGPAGTVAWCLERLATKLPNYVISTSPHTAERLKERTCRMPVIVAAGGVDLDLARRTEAAGEKVDVVSVGRLLAHKRFDLLLDCIALLSERERPVTCRIIGDGPEHAALLQQAQRLGIDHLVEFRSGVEDDDLLPLVKAGRLFVFPSEREGFGIAALEAIACGVPVITTSAEHNHARHLVPRSARGLVCEPNPPALAAAVDSILTRGPDLEAAGHFDDDWVREYDWGTLAANVAVALNPAVTPISTQSSESDGHVRTQLPPIEGADPGIDATDVSPVVADEATPVEPALPRSRTEERRSRHGLADLAISIVGVLAIGAFSRVRGVWIAQAAELLLLLTIPGFVLLRAARVSADAARGFPLYVVCASIAVIMAAGLTVDLIGPGLGVARPLGTVPVTLAICAVCAALILVAFVRGAPSLLGELRGEVRLWRAWPLLLPIAAWIGAMRLNNGDGRAIAIAAVAATGAVLMVGAWRAGRWTTAQTALLVYCGALALIWGFSLRGHFVYGFDVTSEYRTFTQVLHHGRWYAAHHNDSYGAMLSLTILPSALAAMTGASPLLILKAIYPCLFAFVPVGVYLLATRVLERRFAYFAVLFIVVQTYLFQTVPAIARQEIALLFFVCLVFAMFDRRLRRDNRIVLLSLFAIGVVLSHYSSAYVTIAALGAAVVLELLRRLVRPHAGKIAIAPFATALVIMGGAAAIWYQPVTDSAQNLSQFFSDLGNKGISPLPNAGGNVVRSYLSGNVTSRVSAQRFATLAHTDYAKTRKYVHPLPQAAKVTFNLQDATVPGARVRSAPALRGLDVEQTVFAQLTNLLAVVGALMLWWRRRGDSGARGIALLGVATLLLLVVARFSGTVSTDYNQERAFLQAMVPLSICLAWTLQRGSRHPRFGPALPVAFAVAVGLMFLTTSGLRSPILGGAAAGNLTSEGEDYDRYYVASPEMAAARWLNGEAPHGEIVSTDRYGAQRILGATGRVDGVLPQLTPLTLDRHAWVYADTANFTGHRARGEEGSRYAVYVWPSFIGEFWNLVYTNGSTGVYARTH